MGTVPPCGVVLDAASADPVAPAFSERTKQVLDDALPGANAAAARILFELAQVTHQPAYRQRAEATLEALAGLIGCRIAGGDLPPGGRGGAGPALGPGEASPGPRLWRAPPCIM